MLQLDSYYKDFCNQGLSFSRPFLRVSSYTSKSFGSSQDLAQIFNQNLGIIALLVFHRYFVDNLQRSFLASLFYTMEVNIVTVWQFGSILVRTPNFLERILTKCLGGSQVENLQNIENTSKMLEKVPANRFFFKSRFFILQFQLGCLNSKIPRIFIEFL